jgi:hypothetical protein
LLTH